MLKSQKLSYMKLFPWGCGCDTTHCHFSTQLMEAKSFKNEIFWSQVGFEPCALALVCISFFLDLAEKIFINLQRMQHDVSKVSSNTDLLAELKKIASDKGFVISDNEGLGNCLFHALSEQLNLVKGIKISHGELRRSIVQYLRKNPKLVSLVFFVMHILVKIIFICGVGKCVPHDQTPGIILGIR